MISFFFVLRHFICFLWDNNSFLLQFAHKFCKFFPHALKGQKLLATCESWVKSFYFPNWGIIFLQLGKWFRPVWLKLPNTPWTNGHRLKGIENRWPKGKAKVKGRLIEVARPEGAEALSPGHRPGLSCSQTCRPVRAKALKLTRKFIKLLPLQGALLTVTIPRALPWAKSFCPFRACCLYPLPWAMNFWDFSPFQPYSSSDFWRLFESQCIVTTSQIGKCAMVDCFSYIRKCSLLQPDSAVRLPFMPHNSFQMRSG